MVAYPNPATAVFVLLLQAGQQPVLRRLDPQQRAKLLAALAAFVILGFLLMGLAWLGARATRRYMRLGSNRGDTPTARSTVWHEDAWARKPLDSDESP